MVYWATTAVLSPILLAQGLLTRSRTPLLPEPPGDRAGIDGSGRMLRLLITGDSAAAGVGARDQSEALLGQLRERLRPAWQLEWNLIARTGATTVSTRRHLETAPARALDVVVTSLGVNDLTRGTTIRSWLSEQALLRAVLRSRFGARLIVVSGLPPVHRFPALPQPLRWHLGRRARQMSRALHADVAQEADCLFVPLDMDGGPEMMASDGFHPGPPVYKLWAGAVADGIDKRLRLE